MNFMSVLKKDYKKGPFHKKKNQGYCTSIPFLKGKNPWIVFFS